MFTDVRRVPAAVVLAVVALPPLTVWAYTRSPSIITWTRELHRATGGLVTQTLQLAGVISILVVAMLIGVGKLRPRDFGLRSRDIMPAVLYSILTWVLISILGVIITMAIGKGVHVAGSWRSESVATAGRLIAQFLGNALNEELVWRGFLVAQLFLWIRSKWNLSDRASLFRAATVAAVLFAFSHVPIDAAHGLSAAGHAQMFVVRVMSGLLLTSVWLASRDLLVAVACHSLMNEPAPLWQSDAAGVLSAVVALGTLAWVFARRSAQDRRARATARGT